MASIAVRWTEFLSLFDTGCGLGRTVSCYLGYCNFVVCRWFCCWSRCHSDVFVLVARTFITFLLFARIQLVFSVHMMRQTFWRSQSKKDCVVYGLFMSSYSQSQWGTSHIVWCSRPCSSKALCLWIKVFFPPKYLTSVEYWTLIQCGEFFSTIVVFVCLVEKAEIFWESPKLRCDCLLGCV